MHAANAVRWENDPDAYYGRRVEQRVGISRQPVAPHPDTNGRAIPALLSQNRI